ncbi:LamG-like jellyroll fold domain-containing protein [Serinibacter arcticus]|nr:LamG-like jellyroll fold domain-containing protein [Serinibacter arcticus]
MTGSRPRRGARTTSFTLASALALTGVAGMAGAAHAAPVPEAPPQAHLHYSMDDIDGSTVPDSSGNDLDGTISGSTSVVASDDGQALRLPGGADGGYVTVPRGALEGATDLTVSTRVSWDGDGGSWQWLYGLGSDTTRYLFTTPSSGSSQLRTSVTTGGGGGEAQVTGSAALPGERWVTLTTTLDTSADEVVTYLDGVEVSSASTAIGAGELLTQTATSAGYLGRSFYNDPRFKGSLDDVQIFHEALDAEQVAALVGGELPTLVALADTSPEVRTAIGTPPTLPSHLPGEFTDGYNRDVPVTWEAVDPALLEESGTFTVDGDASGTPVTAEVTVHRGELRVDLGTDTGEFVGGASGLLYGLYADGMPTDNLIEGMGVRSIATKAQDGAQHPGSDGLEVLEQLSQSTGGDVYMRIVDYYRGFPYEWPGTTPEERYDDFKETLEEQLDLIATVPAEQLENLVIEPFNEPEGNTHGTGPWSYDGTSWLDDPTDYFQHWDETYRTIKARYPDMRIAGPGTSVLYSQVEGFLEHAVASDTVPDIITWHELSDPQQIRTSVERFRGWEAGVFEGTDREGTELPININEYAFNYHTSVPGQMIQWISAIEDTKVDAMIAFWNLNGNLSDSAVQSNRGNGQWWLYNAYSQMSGHTVEVTPPSPGENYSLQGLATLDPENALAKVILGGAEGTAPVDVVNIPEDVFGSQVRATVREIPWTGQLGDSAQPRHLGEFTADVTDGTVTLDFGGAQLPELTESSAYEIVLTPAGVGETTAADPLEWEASYEAEDARGAGAGYQVNGPEGSETNVSGYFTSGGLNVGGLRTDSDVTLDFDVEVPADGTYDLSVFSSSLNTFARVAEQGPTNIFVSVDGAQEREIHLPLSYKWVVWDSTSTAVDLTAGTHTIRLAARSLDGENATVGDAIVDRITLELASENAENVVYEAEHASLDGGQAQYDLPTGASADDVSGAGTVRLDAEDSATFWVYGAENAEATLTAQLHGEGQGQLWVNGREVLDLAQAQEVAAHLDGGVNKIVVTGTGSGLTLDRLVVSPGRDAIGVTQYQAEDARVGGSAAVVDLSLAEGGKAVSGIGGEQGNGNTLTFDVEATQDGTHAVVFRFSNPEQVPATHYNPNPMGRHADIRVNDGEIQREMFVPTFHRNNFWERTVVLDLEEGANTITISAQELPNWNGETFASDTWPLGFNLRAVEAPIIDRISVSPLRADTGPVEPQPRAFVDVPAGTQFEREITWLAENEISTGWDRGDGTFEFRPVTPIARDAMAAFLFRLAGDDDYRAPTVSPFSDVDTSNQFYKEIAWLAEEGISTGWDNGDGTVSFRPLEPIGRDAMAAFLYRMAESPSFTVPSVSPFTDVAPSNQFYKEITWLVSEEIATGWLGNDGTAIYRPVNPINRDAMAAFLYRYVEAGFASVD